MRIEYQSAYKEYEEASKAVEAYLAKMRKKGVLMRVLPIAFVLYFFASMFFWQWRTAESASIVNFHVFAPPGLSVVSVLVVLVLMSLLAGRLPRWPAKAWIAIGLLVVLACSLVGVVMLLPASTTQPSSAGWGIDLLLPHSTWLALVVMITILLARHIPNERHEHWDRHPSLRRRKSAEITADGVVIKDDVTESHYRWEGFLGFRETKKLFVLMTSLRTAQYFPKRAFAGEEELRAMRALLELIPRSTTTGFPIQQTGAAVPPPVTQGVN
jgi:hypothetical protein